MLKNILKLKGAEELNKSIQKNISGGMYIPYCPCFEIPKKKPVFLCAPDPFCEP